MPRVNYNPIIEPSREARMPDFRYDERGRKAVEQANQNVAQGLGNAVNQLGQWKLEQLNNEFGTDMIAGDAMLDQLKAKRDTEIKTIPVDSSINYDEKVKNITQRYRKEWDNWSSKNIRNRDYDLVESKRLESIKAFEEDGKAEIEKHRIDYERSRNLNQIELAEGIAFTSLKEDPTNQDALNRLKQLQYTRTHLGFQTEAEEAQNGEEIESQAKRLNDRMVQTQVENLVYDGEYEKAEELIQEGFSDNVNKHDKEAFRDKAFGSATYNRFNASINDLNKISELREYQEKVEANPYLSEDIHKSILKNRAEKAIRSIEKHQKKNTLDFIRSAEDGELDSDAWSRTEGDEDSEFGIYGDRGQVELVLLETQKLYEAEEQIKSDQKEFKLASKKEDSGGIERVHGEHQKILEWQLQGNMELQQVQKRIEKYDEWVSEGKVSPAIHRQLQRELVKAMSSALEDGQIHRDTSIWKRGKDLSDAEVKAYQTATEAFRFQNEKLGEFLNFSDEYENVQNSVDRFIKTNPDPKPDELNSFIQDLVEPIRLMTLREIMLSGDK